MLIVAKRQKTHRTHFGRDDDLDCHSWLIYNDGDDINPYHRGSVYTMGPHRLGENTLILDQLLCAADSDDILLFSRCSLIAYQGIYQHTTERSRRLQRLS